MIIFALDPATHDLYLDSSGNIARLSTVAEVVSQRIICRLKLFRGECFVNVTIGVPYFTDVFKKHSNLNTLRSLFVSEISKVSGVKQVDSLEVSFDNSTRKCLITFSVTATDGTSDVSGSTSL